jgi:hypothetical protein
MLLNPKTIATSATPNNSAFNHSPMRHHLSI